MGFSAMMADELLTQQKALAVGDIHPKTLTLLIFYLNGSAGCLVYLKNRKTKLNQILFMLNRIVAVQECDATKA